MKRLRAAQERQLYFTRKQLRSRLPRRRRLHISPVILFPAYNSHFAAATEISGDSSITSIGSRKQPDVHNEFQRVVTRTYYRKMLRNQSKKCDVAPVLSEHSCVESCSVANRELQLKSVNLKESEAEGGEVTKPEASTASRFSFFENNVVGVKEIENCAKLARNDAVFEFPGVHRVSGEEIANSEADKDCSLPPDLSLHGKIKIIDEEAASGQLRIPKLISIDCDLTCSEQYSNGGVLDFGREDEQQSYSSSESLQVVSDLEFESSDYTPSLWCCDSDSQFSVGDESSPTFLLFNQLKQQFCKSNFSLAACDAYNCHEIMLLGLGNEEDEESYKMLRKRERRQVYLHDYAEEYCHTTDSGNLVIQQRLHMVHWIVEQATKEELQKETMFLAVSLLDRFLSKGYFKNMRNLQIAGIACLTLATRIEENQPFNCIRRKSFCVGNTTYWRSEVVAMEWLVQEVLNFQCFLPTLYNFLWFYLKAGRSNEHVEKIAKYLAVLALMGHQQLCYWPSTVAAALVILASIAANQDASCHLVTAIHARQKDKDLPDCIKNLEWLVKYL